MASTPMYMPKKEPALRTIQRVVLQRLRFERCKAPSVPGGEGLSAKIHVTIFGLK